MPTMTEIEKMGAQAFVDEVVKASYEQHVLDEEGIKSEEEFIALMKRNKEPLSDEWIETMFKCW